ncbi:SsgA family sporulation/cell division regulator OS=Streptomyces tendae OX=1932 GN=F3L20_15675 PE=4 SV=1 [Streptomyces tendae]
MITTHATTTVPSAAVPPLRLRLAPHGSLPRRIDGVWWPHSRDLLTQLPRLLAALPTAWGDITGVTVNSTAWSVAPGRMLVANQVVRLNRTTAPHAPDTMVLISPGRGRWDLLVVPPDTPEEAAASLMTSAGTYRPAPAADGGV